MPRQRLAVRHVFVGFDPCGSSDFPAAFMHAALYFLKHFGRVLFDNAVYRSLRLSVGELGILLHQRQYCAEGIDCHRRRFVIAPHPVHIDVGMRYAIYGKCLYRAAKVRKPGFDLLSHGSGQRLAFADSRDKFVSRRLDTRVKLAAADFGNTGKAAKLIVNSPGPVIGVCGAVDNVEFL